MQKKEEIVEPIKLPSPKKSTPKKLSLIDPEEDSENKKSQKKPTFKKKIMKMELDIDSINEIYNYGGEKGKRMDDQ